MEQKNDRLNSQHDDQLADFADQVMQGRIEKPASPQTDDLLGLKDTILRLNRSFPPTSLDEATIKQMHVRLRARIRREEQTVKPSFWARWFGKGISPQLGLAFAVLAVLVVMIIGAPSLIIPGSGTTGTASTPVSFFIAAGLAGALVVIYWLTRRK